ncbi:hypothetical protein K474DRAFT_1658361 [Panus rudis PR-1116 ss-1]|nr:hypothetical protein K474DRAFT_1658361 [Panus rudis PR-1116 ss-1]
MVTFLHLPAEIRLAIYETYLADHQVVRDRRQPSNEHIRVLHTCKQILSEAGPIFCSYVSLLHERQIHAFLASSGHVVPSQVAWADVANDGRFLQTSTKPDEEMAYPLSQLHAALHALPGLTHLRVFECRQGLPISLHSLVSRRFFLRFEEAMFPSSCAQRLQKYELHLGPSSRVRAFARIHPGNLRTVRFSGDCQLAPNTKFPALQNLTLHGVTGNYFDRHDIRECFPAANLTSFAFVLDSKDGFQLRDLHLRSLAIGPGRHLQRLTLMGCIQLSSAAIADCLSMLTSLSYLALSLITIDELRTNFVDHIPPTLRILKLHIRNAWFTPVFWSEERCICDSIEGILSARNPPLEQLALSLRSELLEEDGRRERWHSIAQGIRLHLYIGPWELQEHN